MSDAPVLVQPSIPKVNQDFPCDTKNIIHFSARAQMFSANV
jgi:hypothetical protein